MSAQRYPKLPIKRVPWCRTGSALVALGLVIALAGCSSDDDTDDARVSSSDPATSQAPDGADEDTPDDADGSLALKTVGGQGKSAVVAGNQGNGTDPFDGKLIIAERGCLHLVDRSDESPTLLVFPPGTTLDVSGKPTVVVDGNRHTVGSRLTLTGEQVSLNDADADAVQPCVARGPVFQIASVS